MRRKSEMWNFRNTFFGRVGKSLIESGDVLQENVLKFIFQFFRIAKRNVKIYLIKYMLY